MITMLPEAGFSDSSIALRTSHRNVNSLMNYANLSGRLGQQQFESLLGNSPPSETPAVPVKGYDQHINLERTVNASSHNQPSSNLGVSNISAPHGTITINVYRNASKQ